MPVIAIALISFAAAAAVFVIEVIYARKHVKKPAARVEKAKALGHSVRAELVNEHFKSNYRRNDGFDEADYKYEVNGHTYKYYYFEKQAPPMFITLYWIHDPRYAFWGESRSVGQKANIVLTRLLPLIVFVAVAALLIGIFGIA